MQAQPQSRRQCIGLVVDPATQLLVRCPEFVTGRSNRRYHSKRCYEWTWHRYGDHFQLGDRYVKGQHRKQHPVKLCSGWTIRDGVIAECAEPFNRGRSDKRHHTLQCFHRTRRWRRIGFNLGDRVGVVCANRKCKRAFIPLHLSPKQQDHFCNQRCRAAEYRNREADSIAAQLAKAARIAAGRPREDQKAAVVAELRAARVPWKEVAARVNARFHEFASEKSLQDLLRRRRRPAA